MLLGRHNITSRSILESTKQRRISIVPGQRIGDLSHRHVRQPAEIYGHQSMAGEWQDQKRKQTALFTKFRQRWVNQSGLEDPLGFMTACAGYGLETIGLSTMSVFIGRSALSNSPCSRLPTSNLSSVAMRSPTSASNSSPPIDIPACVNFISRPS